MGATLGLVLSSFGIISLYNKHKAEAGINSKDMSRHNREKRLEDKINSPGS